MVSVSWVSRNNQVGQLQWGLSHPYFLSYDQVLCRQIFTMKRTGISLWLVLALLLLPVSAIAQSSAHGSTRSSLDVFGGPDDDYPIIEHVDVGVPTTLYGCLASRVWCDVSMGHVRGWALASHLQVSQAGALVPLSRVSPSLPVIGFALRNYWSQHYRDSSFFKDKALYQNQVPNVRPGQPHQADNDPPRQDAPGD